MAARLGRRRLKKIRMGPGRTRRFEWVRFQLSASVVEARAGLIPSEETDLSPPPEGLNVTEYLAWHSGLPVWRKRRAKRP